MKFVFTEPFVGVDPLRFGMAEHDVGQVLGEPDRVSRSRHGELIYWYPDSRLSFDKQSVLLSEVTFFRNARIEVLGICPLEGDHDYIELLKTSENVLEFAGILLLTSLGISLSGFHDDNPDVKTITVFERGRFDPMLPKFAPYVEDY